MFQELTLQENSSPFGVSQQKQMKKKAAAKQLNEKFLQYVEDNKENFDPQFNEGKNSLSGKFESRPHYLVLAPTV